MIALFTGTGNSLAVAREISRRLGDTIHLIRPGATLPSGSERVIWVFPVYSWGLPPIVADYARAQPALAARPHWCVLTCGDDVGLADHSWRRDLRRAGATDLRGVWSVMMPNTYVCLPGFDVDSPALTRDKLAAMPGRVGHICAAIETDRADTDVTRGSFAWIKTRLIYPLFRRFMMSPRPFHTTAGCTACGLCARSCPLGNITMDGAAHPADRSPRWHDHCTLCLRCYHICTRHAIAYGRATTSKGQKQVTL